jgi:hypothetical protein
MRVQLAGVAKHHGAKTILDGVTLTVGVRSTVVVVSHDRRFLEAIEPTREIRLVSGRAHDAHLSDY